MPTYTSVYYTALSLLLLNQLQYRRQNFAVFISSHRLWISALTISLTFRHRLSLLEWPMVVGLTFVFDKSNRLSPNLGEHHEFFLLSPMEISLFTSDFPSPWWPESPTWLPSLLRDTFQLICLLVTTNSCASTAWSSRLDSNPWFLHRLQCTSAFSYSFDIHIYCRCLLSFLLNIDSLLFYSLAWANVMLDKPINLYICTENPDWGQHLQPLHILGCIVYTSTFSVPLVRLLVSYFLLHISLIHNLAAAVSACLGLFNPRNLMSGW